TSPPRTRGKRCGRSQEALSPLGKRSTPARHSADSRTDGRWGNPWIPSNLFPVQVKVSGMWDRIPILSPLDRIPILSPLDRMGILSHMREGSIRSMQEVLSRRGLTMIPIVGVTLALLAAAPTAGPGDKAQGAPPAEQFKALVADHEAAR